MTITNFLSFAKTLLVIPGILLLFSCSGPDKFAEGSFPQTEDISFGAVTTNGSTAITIPLEELANNEADLVNVTIKIYNNGFLTYSNITATQYFNDAFDAVMFSIQGVNAGDALKLELTKSDGSIQEHSALLSADATVYP